MCLSSEPRMMGTMKHLLLALSAAAILILSACMHEAPVQHGAPADVTIGRST